VIKLYREKNSRQAEAIEAKFREMVLGYDRVVVDGDGAVQLFGEERDLPILTNNEKIVSGEQIRPYIQELGQLMRDWQLFQGDACYVDDNGETC